VTPFDSVQDGPQPASLNEIRLVRRQSGFAAIAILIDGARLTAFTVGVFIRED
jgi:hypothetical protein